MKKALWFAIGAGTVVLLLVAVLTVILASPAQRVLASSLSGNGLVGGPPWAQMWQHGGWGGPGFSLPPELQGLTSIPAGERFSHFEGAQVNLKDQNNQPITINVVPGKVTSVDATSLTIVANNGKSQTFTLNSQTMIHAGAVATPSPTGTPNTPAGLKNGEDVVVVTLNNNTTATAVIAAGSSGFGGPAHGGWWNRNSQ